MGNKAENFGLLLPRRRPGHLGLRYSKPLFLLLEQYAHHFTRCFTISGIELAIIISKKQFFESNSFHFLQTNGIQIGRQFLFTFHFIQYY